ncbi:hypothetical protein E4U44_004170 [Claviceps purpurea]|nr:hypothetical protein E4U44_004170 [Claviceps purpurea]
MLKGANLPSELWPESAQAAAYLYNMGPIQRLEWKSPIQVIEAWFREIANSSTHGRSGARGRSEPALVQD